LSLKIAQKEQKWSNPKKHKLSLSCGEFLRCLLLHLLPEGFARIRNFGFRANRKRAIALPLCFQLLGAAPQTEQKVSTAGPSDLGLAPSVVGRSGKAKSGRTRRRNPETLRKAQLRFALHSPIFELFSFRKENVSVKLRKNDGGRRNKCVPNLYAIIRAFDRFFESVSAR
jgi:hypothetical protein